MSCQKVLIFSQMVRVLGILEDYLVQRGHTAFGEMKGKWQSIDLTRRVSFHSNFFILRWTFLIRVSHLSRVQKYMELIRLHKHIILLSTNSICCDILSWPQPRIPSPRGIRRGICRRRGPPRNPPRNPPPRSGQAGLLSACVCVLSMH